MKAVMGVCLIGLVLSVSVSAESLIEGRVRLESGAPVADAQVRLFDMTDLQRGAIARATTDGTGYFALPWAALTGRALPARFALGPNYPNPFNPSTIIPYQLAASSAVRLEVFNLLGQRLATLVDGERPAGFHTALWNATDATGRAVGAGVYIYRMTVGVASQTGRMVLLDGQAGVSAAGAASVWSGASGVGGSDGEGAQVYGLVVSGRGLVPYVDSSFWVEAGMAPVELVVSSGPHSAGKATDDDCPLCDFFDAFNDAAKEKEKGPDLIVQSPSVSDTALTEGQAFTLNVTVHNQGDEQAAATMLHYYRSNNSTITSSDTEVGTDEIGALDASATNEASIELTAPTGVSPGLGIYYGACVASVSGESKTDNNCSSAVKITVGGQEATEEEAEEADDEAEEPAEPTEPVKGPNLTVTITARPQIIEPGRKITIEATVRNKGNAAADSQTITVYQHSEKTATPHVGGTEVAPYETGPLWPRLTMETWTEIHAPFVASSTIYYYACVTPATGETQTDDNCDYAAVQVQARFETLAEESDFDIELVFLNSFSEQDKRVIQYAARKWMSIIREDLPDYTFASGWSGKSYKHSYEIPSGERIDDLRIYVESFVDYRDNAPFGRGGIDVLRQTLPHLPVVGIMNFNTRVSISLSTALHEIGHVLGIGIWHKFHPDSRYYQQSGYSDFSRFFQNELGDVHFNGPLAIAAFDDAGGWNYTGKKVPLEEGGAHWRPSVLAGETMHPTSGGALSAITIQALADMGYVVDVTQADPYTLPSTEEVAAKVVAAGSTPERRCGAGHRQEPIYVVDPQGRVVRTLHR